MLKVAFLARGKTYSFEVFNRYVFHYAFVNEFLVGSASEKHASIEFALALPHVVRTVAVRTLIFKKLNFSQWKRSGDFRDDEAGSSAFDGLVMSFSRIDRLSINDEDSL